MSGARGCALHTLGRLQSSLHYLQRTCHYRSCCARNTENVTANCMPKHQKWSINILDIVLSLPSYWPNFCHIYVAAQTRCEKNVFVKYLYSCEEEIWIHPDQRKALIEVPYQSDGSWRSQEKELENWSAVEIKTHIHQLSKENSLNRVKWTCYNSLPTQFKRNMKYTWFPDNFSLFH